MRGWERLGPSDGSNEFVRRSPLREPGLIIGDGRRAIGKGSASYRKGLGELSERARRAIGKGSAGANGVPGGASLSPRLSPRADFMAAAQPPRRAPPASPAASVRAACGGAAAAA